MSQENVESLRRAYDALNGGNAEPLIAGSHRDMEFVSILSGVEGESGIFRGHAGIRAYLANLPEVWSSWRWDVLELTALDDQRVLVVVDFHAVGVDSHVPVTAQLAVIYQFVGGLVSRAAAYANREAALEAVGLSE
ncbi:MAG: nuclear transport factor 2 family protein [Thermoleophilaceae bacterium]|nr:nuclear transport factor 2 family protein [Thermoleophilaceae bacterium]